MKTNKKDINHPHQKCQKFDNQDHLQERSKNQNRKLNHSKKTKNNKQKIVVQNIKSKQEKHFTKEVCGHGWGKEQEQRHKPKESEEKCLLVTRNTKGGTNECDIRWEKGESKTNQKEEKDKKEDKSV